MTVDGNVTNAASIFARAIAGTRAHALARGVCRAFGGGRAAGGFGHIVRDRVELRSLLAVGLLDRDIAAAPGESCQTQQGKGRKGERICFRHYFYPFTADPARNNARTANSRAGQSNIFDFTMKKTGRTMWCAAKNAHVIPTRER